MGKKTLFHPFVHGWHFPNDPNLTSEDFEYDFNEYNNCRNTAIKLAGGMITLALDKYFTGSPISRQRTFPAPGSSLRSALVQRHRSLVIKNDLWTSFNHFAARPDHPNPIYPHTIGYQTKREWWDHIRPSLDQGIPMPIGAVFPGQVRALYLVHDYSIQGSTQVVTLQIYNPRSPSLDLAGGTFDYWGADIDPHFHLEFDLDEEESQINAKLYINNTPYPMRGFFHLDHPGVRRIGRIDQLQIQSLDIFEPPQVSVTEHYTRRRERFQLVVSMETNIVPYFTVRKDEEEREFWDTLSGEMMRPHACDSNSNLQYLILSYDIHLTAEMSGEEWEMKVHVDLEEQHSEASVLVPPSRILKRLYLHSLPATYSIFDGADPVDVRQDDIAIVEQNITGDLSEESINVLISPEPASPGIGPQLLTGWRTTYHLGYITKPIYCHFSLERMLEPSKIEIKREGIDNGFNEIPPENWERYLLRPGFTSDEYDQEISDTFNIRAEDVTNVHPSSQIRLVAKNQFAFIKPIYSHLADWHKFETVLERIHEYIDRDFLKEMLERFSSHHQSWIRHNRKLFLSEAAKTCQSGLANPDHKLKNEIIELNTVFLETINKRMKHLKKETGAKQDRGKFQHKIQKDLMLEYDEQVIKLIKESLIFEEINEEFLEQTIRTKNMRPKTILNKLRNRIFLG